MSLSPTVYQSRDAGAPALTGQVGSFLDVLRACLVTGYGSGATAKAGAGWTEPFASTGNVAVFRNSALQGSGAFFRFNDGGTGSAGARAASAHVYSSMSDLATGADMAPSAALRSGGVQYVKSSTLDAVARPWTILANERAVHVFVQESGTVSPPKYAGFGDLISNKPGDSYPAFLSGASGYVSGQLVKSGACLFDRSTASNDAMASGSTSTITFVLRTHAGASGGAPLYLLNTLKHAQAGVPYGHDSSFFSLPSPEPASEGVVMERAHVVEPGFAFRGRMPGVWLVFQRLPFADLFSGELDGYGPVFAKHYNVTASASSGVLVFDLGPWV